jgi:hypothetical protein
MIDLAVEQIRHGREPDVRVRPHVDTGREIRGAHVIEEDERAYEPALHRRERSANGEAAEVARMRCEEEFDGLVRGSHTDAHGGCRPCSMDVLASSGLRRLLGCERFSTCASHSAEGSH